MHNSSYTNIITMRPTMVSKLYQHVSKSVSWSRGYREFRIKSGGSRARAIFMDIWGITGLTLERWFYFTCTEYLVESL